MPQESKMVQMRPQLPANGPQVCELVVDPARRCGDDGGRDAGFKVGTLRDEAFRSTKGATPDYLTTMPDYLQGLELVNRAARAMQTMEDHSQQIQNKAFEFMQQARYNRLEAEQKIATLQEELAASESKIDELSKKLEQAEQRAKTAEEWLRRFLDAINTGFAARRACKPDSVRAAA